MQSDSNPSPRRDQKNGENVSRQLSSLALLQGLSSSSSNVQSKVELNPIPGRDQKNRHIVSRQLSSQPLLQGSSSSSAGTTLMVVSHYLMNFNRIRARTAMPARAV